MQTYLIGFHFDIVNHYLIFQLFNQKEELLKVDDFQTKNNMILDNINYKKNLIVLQLYEFQDKLFESLKIQQNDIMGILHNVETQNVLKIKDKQKDIEIEIDFTQNPVNQMGDEVSCSEMQIEENNKSLQNENEDEEYQEEEEFSFKKSEFMSEQSDESSQLMNKKPHIEFIDPSSKQVKMMGKWEDTDNSDIKKVGETNNADAKNLIESKNNHLKKMSDTINTDLKQQNENKTIEKPKSPGFLTKIEEQQDIHQKIEENNQNTDDDIQISIQGESEDSIKNDIIFKKISTDESVKIEISGGVATIQQANQYFASNNGKLINIYDNKSNQIIKSMKGHTNVVTGLIFSKDEKKLYSASADRTIRIWELDNFSLIKTIQEAHKKSVNTIALASNDNILLSGGSDGYIQAWNTKTYQSVKQLYEMQHNFQLIKVCNDKFATISEENKTHHLKIYSLQNYSCLFQLQNLQNQVSLGSAISFSNCQKYLAVAGPGDKLTILKTKNFQQLIQIQINQKIDITSVQFLQNQTICTGDTQGNINLVDLDKGILQKVKFNDYIMMLDISKKQDKIYIPSRNNQIIIQKLI